jgi:hypothetical protein
MFGHREAVDEDVIKEEEHEAQRNSCRMLFINA